MHFQNGYADGVADGRAKLYQEDFDRGYEKGFSMGFELARYQGFAIGAQKQADKIPQAKLMQSDLILKQHAARAHCQLCVNKALERNGMGEILEIQTRHNEGVTSKLMERFRNVE